ncbi:MAG: hypothetical protein DRP79_08210 [Planctomycetota bacterium]|nr:MAG: hypothetical protein DRP79_08210 [Planctomycetota bacterium]
MPIAPPSQIQHRITNIQYPFDNTFDDVWEYEKSFSSINFESYLGDQCPLCGRSGCYKQISEYYRNAITLFPHKKDVVPVARFLCHKSGRTFSLLPYQLIPYHQYTIDAIIGTLLAVYHFQSLGQQGYHGASLDLDPDCLVTPYLVHTWAILIITGLIRGHAVLQGAYPVSSADKATSSTMIRAIYLYLEAVVSQRRCVLPAVRRFCHRTNGFLFGVSSGDRSRAP